MKRAQFSQNQYVDQGILNTAESLTASGLTMLASGFVQAGLVRPDAMLLAFSGLAASATLARPFGVLFGNGTFADAHGTVTGSDTQVYPVSFASLVPASGSITAYMVASLSTIQQDAYTVIGPPVGHPDYNPGFVPYTAYNTNVDTLSISATSGVPDNITTFELARFTLAAGATGLAASTVYQRRATSPLQSQVIPVSGIYTVAIVDAGRTHQFTASGSAVLPLASGANGLIFPFANASPDAVTIQVVGGGAVYGPYLTGTSGVTGISMQPGDACIIAGEFNRWQLLGGTAGPLGIDALLPAGLGPLPWSGSTAPAGWLLCYGQNVSRTTYSRLHAVYASAGYPYGSGDGVLTFGIPDARGRNMAGLDNMGGSAASRMTSGVAGFSTTTLGAAGGDQRRALHGHTLLDSGHDHYAIDTGHQHGPQLGQGYVMYDVSGGAGYQAGPSLTLNNAGFTAVAGANIVVNPNFTNASIATDGAGTAQNVQPTMVTNMIVKT